MPIRMLAALVCVALLTGCAGSHFDVERFQTDVVTGDYPAALAVLEKGGRENDVSDLLDRGLVLSELGRYPESNEAFQQAEDLIADLYTRSVSKEALALLTSDNTLDYRASGFEHAYIAYYRAWNYLESGESEGVLVEARKINERLNFLSDTCPEQDGGCGHHAFLRYFSGLLFEWGGEVNDAYVAYKQADIAAATATRRFKIAPPPDLGVRLVRLARVLGFDEESRRFAEDYRIDTSVAEPRRFATLAVFLENGIVGRRVEEAITIPIFSGETRLIAADRDAWSGRLAGRSRVVYDEAKLEYLLRVAIPGFQDNPPPARRGRFLLGSLKEETRVVDDVSARARAGLDDAMGGILTKAIARALTKYLAKRTADKQIGEGAGLLVNLLGAATERADTRSWRSLPHDLQLAVIEAPAGAYEGTLKLLGPGGGVVEEISWPSIELAPGEIRFLRHRSYR